LESDTVTTSRCQVLSPLFGPKITPTASTNKFDPAATGATTEMLVRPFSQVANELILELAKKETEQQ